MSKGMTPISRKAYKTIKRDWAKGAKAEIAAAHAGVSKPMVYVVLRSRDYETYLNGRREPNQSLWHRIFK